MKTAFLFSGGGAQYPGMMKDLYDNIPECKEIFDRADQTLGIELSKTILEGSNEDLTKTDTMLPAVFVADMSAYAAISACHIFPDYGAGFSLGEWAAISASGVLPFELALRLVKKRSEAMDKATPINGAGMAVILGQPNEQVEEMCKQISSGYVCPANYNYDGQVTVSGTKDGLLELEKLAKEKGVRYMRLAVNVPSHCLLMEPAMKTMDNLLKDICFFEPIFPVLPNVTAYPTVDPNIIKRSIIIQLVRPVLFEQTISKLLDEEVDVFVELGPGKTLTGFVKKTAKKNGKNVTALHVEDTKSLYQTVETIRGGIH